MNKWMNSWMNFIYQMNVTSDLDEFEPNHYINYYKLIIVDSCSTKI